MSGVWHITVEGKIMDKFSKMLYQKNENVLWKARYIKVSILFNHASTNFHNVFNLITYKQ
jgi:hypothetical protein